MRTDPKALSIRHWCGFCALVLVAQIFSLGSLPFDVGEPWDKVWHFIAYSSLALLLWIATDGRWPTLVIAAVIVLGGLDELRQSFIPARSADMWDFCADATAAAVTGAVLIWKTGARKPCAESSAP